MMWSAGSCKFGTKLRFLDIDEIVFRGRAPRPSYLHITRPDDGPPAAAVAAEIAASRRLGFHDHKIKVGGLSVSEDAQRVAAATASTARHGSS